MRTINKVILLGNVARAPELKTTINGKTFCTFTIATHKEFFKDNQKVTVPEFHNVVAWGNLGEIAGNFCEKGRLVYLEGNLKTRNWEGDSGGKVFRTEIIASNLIALSPSKEQGAENEDSYQSDSPNVDHLNSSRKATQISAVNEDDFFGASEDDFFSSK